MTITFHVESVEPEDLAFASSPALEAVLSLHVLVEPKHHPLQHPFIRDMQVLPPALRRDVERFRFVYQGYFPAFAFPRAAGPLDDFEEELERFAAVPADLARVEYTQTFAGDALGRDPELRASEQGRRYVLAEAARRGPGVAETVAWALDDPQSFGHAFCELLRRYWESGFANHWPRVEAVLGEAIEDAGQRLARGGLREVLSCLWPEVRCDERAERFWLDRPHDHDVHVGPRRPLTMAPSVFVWPHVRVNCDEPWPLAVAFPALHLLDDARPRMPPGELVAALKALGHEGRLQTLRLALAQPRSTEELAALLHMSEAGASRHLQQLARAGLVEADRDGHYVLYRTRPDRLDRLARALDAFLRGGDSQSG